MAYFNHAFCKTFVATEGIVAAGVPVWNLKETSLGFGPGYAGFFDTKTNLALDISLATCPFYVASAALKTNDKQGPQHGGYVESNKSKVVNPKYIRKAWMQEASVASRAVAQIGASAANFAIDPNCNKEFLCGEDYNLRIEVKGSDALRFANHNLYQTLNANGGCCADPALPTAVDPGKIYMQWAKQITGDPLNVIGGAPGNAYLKDFVRPIITADGLSYAENAKVIAEEALLGNTIDGTFADLEVLLETENLARVVGIVLLGSYVETKFGVCTFTPSDYYSVEPIQIFASEVDLNGDPCTFEGLCVSRQGVLTIDGLGTGCEGIQANGLGETVARDIILHESYLSNFFHDDLRIREITQGTDLWKVIDANLLYDRVCLQHVVPRFNNPSGTFDNDQYILDIIVNEGAGGAVLASLAGVLGIAGCEEPETFGTVPCPTVIIPVP